MKLHILGSIAAALCVVSLPAFAASDSDTGGDPGTGPQQVLLNPGPIIVADTFQPDSNDDGFVGGSDFADFIAAWKHYDLRFDVNGDGVIGGQDFAAFTRAFGAPRFAVTEATESTTSAIPEPSAALLFAVGGALVVLGLRRFAQRSTSESARLGQ